MKSFNTVVAQLLDEFTQRLRANATQNGEVLVPTTVDTSKTNMTQIGNAIKEILSKSMRPTIVKGLDVTATVPPSLSVLVSPGYGGAGGNAHELTSYMTVQIPTHNEIYYVNLCGSKVSVDSSSGINILPLAKIVIPNPGVTNKILDDKSSESDYDGYIVSGKDLLFDNNFIIDDESISQLKNTMTKIFAEYIFGTIKLNESLQIANEQGTLRADSDSVNFYDVNGNELASYGAYEARVGNIKVTPSTIQSRDFQENAHGFRLKDNGDAEFDNITARGTIHASAGTIDGDLTVGGSLSSPNFSSGYAGQGWKIDGDGTATFQNGIFRGELHTSVFVKDEIHATNGDLLVTNASILTSGLSTGDTRIYVKESPFTNNTVARIKNEANSEYMLISGSVTGGYNVVRDLDGTGVNAWQAGEAVVGMTSRVSLVASGDTTANLPYLDIIKRNSNTYNDETTKVRLGNLSGITDANFCTLSDYGLYTNNGYFTGNVRASNIFAGMFSGTNGYAGNFTGTNISGGTISGTSSSIGATARFIQTPDNVTAYDTNNNPVFNTTLTGTNSGDTYVGNWSGGKGVYWNMESGTLSIKLSPQTRYYIISPFDPNPETTNYTFTQQPSGINGEITGLTLNSSIHLPQGAIITHLRVYYYRDDAAAVGEVMLLRTPANGIGTDHLIDITYTGTGGRTYIDGDISSYNVVNNDTYFYRLYISLEPNDSVEDVSFISAVVTYTIIDPLP
jgi:hypothetical protein